MAMPPPLRSSPVQQVQQSPYTQHLRDTISHAHPDPQRWQNPGGWGARHMNDKAPFTLWDAENRQFRGPSREERTWIRSKFGEGDLLITGWLLYIETAHPPQPIPLTCGAMPVIFVRPGEMFHQPIPTSGSSNPRVPDPCPTVWWPRMTNPSKSQITEVLTAIAELANVTSVNFLPVWTVFELETGDDHNYELASLPGIVAGRTALYHHDDMPFTQTMRSLTRPRMVDPTQSLADGTIVQDNSNYLQQSVLTPGCRVESEPILPGTLAASVTAATMAFSPLKRYTPALIYLSILSHKTNPRYTLSFSLYICSLRSQKNKTYNSRDSLVVTHPTTNRPACGLNAVDSRVTAPKRCEMVRNLGARATSVGFL